MTLIRRSVGASTVLAVSAAALLAGCSFSAGDSTPKVSSDELGKKVAEQLAASTGQPEPKVDCPEDLEGKVGTTTRCKLTAGDGSTLGVTVKVTSVEDGKVNFDIKADDTPTPAG